MEPNKKAVLPWIIVAVAAVMAIAVWYYNSYMEVYVSPPDDRATTELQTQSASDEINAIGQDLSATDLGDLDKELSDIDAELAR